MWECVGWVAELNKHERSVIHGTLLESRLSAPPTPFFELMKSLDCLSWTSSSSHSFSFPPDIVLPRDAVQIVCFCIFCSELEITGTGGTTGRCEREFVYAAENVVSCVWTICGSEPESSIRSGRVQDEPVLNLAD